MYTSAPTVHSPVFEVIENILIVLTALCFITDLKQFMKAEYLKFRDGSSKLLSGHKFQDKYVVLRAEKLLLYRDIKVSTLLFGA